MKPKYNLFDKVCYLENNNWIVGNISGINSKIGYDLLLWEYTITKGMYGDCTPNFWGTRCDVITSKWLREDQVHSIDYMIKSKKQDIENKKLELEKDIEKLQMELEKL